MLICDKDLEFLQMQCDSQKNMSFFGYVLNQFCISSSLEKKIHIYIYIPTTIKVTLRTVSAVSTLHLHQIYKWRHDFLLVFSAAPGLCRVHNVSANEKHMNSAEFEGGL